jgi:hypothetical protein
MVSIVRGQEAPPLTWAAVTQRLRGVTTPWGHYNGSHYTVGSLHRGVTSPKSHYTAGSLQRGVNAQWGHYNVGSLHRGVTTPWWGVTTSRGHSPLTWAANGTACPPRHPGTKIQYRAKFNRLNVVGILCSQYSV